MTTSTRFEVIVFFPSQLIISDELQEETLTVSQNYFTGTLIGICVRDFLKSWNGLLSKSTFSDFSKARAPYMLSVSSTFQSYCFHGAVRAGYRCRTRIHRYMLAVQARVKKA